jgi:hypothetical protein
MYIAVPSFYLSSRNLQGLQFACLRKLGSATATNLPAFANNFARLCETRLANRYQLAFLRE